jgi:hypothetical protein
MCCDLTENHCIVTLLTAFPERHGAAVERAAVFGPVLTRVKWLGLLAINVVVVAGIIDTYTQPR